VTQYQFKRALPHNETGQFLEDGALRLGRTTPLNTSERLKGTVLHSMSTYDYLLHVLDLFHFSCFIPLFLLHSLFE
jgi:hypothetical protein